MLLAARIVLREYVVKRCGLAVPKWGTTANITAPRNPGRHIGVTKLGTVANSTAIWGVTNCQQKATALCAVQTQNICMV